MLSCLAAGVIYSCKSSSCSTLEPVVQLTDSVDSGVVYDELRGDYVSSDTVYNSPTGYMQVVFETSGSGGWSGFEAVWSVAATTGCALCPAGTYAEADPSMYLGHLQS